MHKCSARIPINKLQHKCRYIPVHNPGLDLPGIIDHRFLFNRRPTVSGVQIDILYEAGGFTRSPSVMHLNQGS